MKIFERRPSPVHCEEIRLATSARRDGESTQIPEKSVDAHLKGCANCRDFDIAIAGMSHGLSLRAAKYPPADLVPLLASLLPGHGSDGEVPATRRATGREAGQPHQKVIRWSTALIPSALAAVFIPIGSSVHPHVSPTLNPTPCTSHLRHRSHHA